MIKITWNELCLDATALPPNRTMSSTEWSSTIRERWAKETSSVFTDKFHSSDFFLVEFSLYFFAPIEMWAHIVFVLEFHFQCDWMGRQECCDIMLSCGESKHPTITRPEMIPLRKHIIVLKMPKKNCFSFFFFFLSHSHISRFSFATTLWHENEMRWQHTHSTNAIDEVHRRIDVEWKELFYATKKNDLCLECRVARRRKKKTKRKKMSKKRSDWKIQRVKM